MTFILGAIIGGGIAINFLGSPAPVNVSAATIADLQALGIQVPRTNAEGTGYLPLELFNKKVSSRKVKNLVPTELSTQTGKAATFLKACIKVATETDKYIAAAAFITAIINGETITLPLLHSECHSILKKDR